MEGWWMCQKSWALLGRTDWGRRAMCVPSESRCVHRSVLRMMQSPGPGQTTSCTLGSAGPGLVLGNVSGGGRACSEVVRGEAWPGPRPAPRRTVGRFGRDESSETWGRASASCRRRPALAGHAGLSAFLCVSLLSERPKLSSHTAHVLSQRAFS